MTLTRFDREEKHGRKTVRRRGVVDESGREFRNAGEAAAAVKRETNPLYGAKVDSHSYCLMRVLMAGSEYWIEVFGRTARMCHAYPFDTQDTMHETMRESGQNLTPQAKDELKRLLSDMLA